jgi:DNA-binding CsgD family transcriptional regulator
MRFTSTPLSCRKCPRNQTLEALDSGGCDPILWSPVCGKPPPPACCRARHSRPIGVLVLSQYGETRQAIKLLQNAPRGVGYLLKDRVSDIAEFADAVRRVARGGSVIDPEVVGQLLRRRRADSALDDLTVSEQDILALMAQGRSNRAICERLFFSPKTVETQVGAISPSWACCPRPTITGESSR